MKIEIRQDVDETGSLEEFTWDLFPLVDASTTLHLEGSGLPRVGSQIEPGMILVGKIARTLSYDPSHQPTPLEIHGLDRQALRQKYGHMWRDTSHYADESQSGTVMSASFVQRDELVFAIVLIVKGKLYSE